MCFPSISLFLSVTSLAVVSHSWELELSKADTEKIRFLLWDKGNTSQVIHPTVESLQNSSLSLSWPVVILIHGWRSDGFWFGGFYNQAYQVVGEYNVISVDWGDLENINYIEAAALTKPVAGHTASLVSALKDVGLFENIHVVGHSLGAHVAGYLGEKVQRMGLGTLKRITGLDPADPGFGWNGPDGRLDKTDAEFVDVLHTNSGILLEGALTIKRPIGHLDFYPAGGVHQPGCSEVCLGELCGNLDLDDFLRGGCSHLRANYYYRESILARGTKSEMFLAWPCQDWSYFLLGKCCGGQGVQMGHWLDTSSPQGSYFMNVGRDFPHALGQDGQVCLEAQCFFLFSLLGSC